MSFLQNKQQTSTAVDRIEQNLQDDSKFRTLGQRLKAAQQSLWSGIQDIDYPNILNLAHRVPAISNLTTVPLPTEVVEQFINSQQNCNLGIFPEIARAWLSVDNVLFVWAYDNASDVAYYDGIDQTILSIHLFKPKANVFKPHIKYVLCIVTASEITLMGVTCSDDDPTALSTVLMIPDALFKISTDNVNLSVTASTDDGRLFLGGNDGCLYEIVYRTEEGWFSRQCNKINHSHSILSYVTPSFLSFSEPEPIVQIEIDNSRHLLYTRSERSTIQIFDLGKDGKSVNQVASKTLSAIVNQASCIARTIDTSNFKPIVGIKPIESSDAQDIHLVAVTQAGVRLYFSAHGSDRPNSLELYHIRLPPGFTPSSAIQRPNSISNIYLREHTFIMTSQQMESKDFLWVMNNDFYVYEDQIMETFSVVSLGGRVWHIAEEIRPRAIKYDQEPLTPPLVVKQHYEERRKFVMLTSEGIQIFYKQRPIDQLRLLLLESQGSDTAEIKSFFNATKPTEACLTSLIIASSSNLPQEVQLAQWATSAFFRYGGEPRVIKSINHNGTFMPTMSTPIGSPILSSTGLNMSPIMSHYNGNTTMTGHIDQSEVQNSTKHDTLFLYLARILRPVWLSKVAVSEIFEINHKVLKNTIPMNEISLYLRRMLELKQFLDTHVQIAPDNVRQNEINDANAVEKESLGQLSRLLTRCIEVLNLYKLMYEHDFSVVCANLPSDPQAKLTQMTFRDLIILGNDMTTTIASALVRKYLDDNNSTDAISRRLHELCPSIFRQENALQAKAHEMILQSRVVIDRVDKERMMEEAVSLLKKIGVKLELQSICDLLHSAKAYKYIVDICLFVADKRDPLQLAHINQQSRMMNNAHDETEERTRATAIAYRLDCYMKIIDTLDRLLNTDEFEDVFASCVKSSDQLFHTKLYEWLCEKNLANKLLEVESPYVETFLKKRADSDTYSTNYLDLMWRYYERRRNFYAAAKILDKLASRTCTDYGLEERIEYLARAKGCIEALAAPSDYLHELEEKVEVIRIQIQIYKKMRERVEISVAQDVISQLNYSLLDLTRLYQDYAQKFSLYDCQLAILKCGNHHNATLIEKLWKSFVDDVLKKNATESVDTRIHILSSQVETLGKALMPSERFFPVYFVIAYLEFRTHQFGNLRWVPNCLMKVGFKPIDLLEPYNKFYKSREHSTFWPGKSVYVLRVIATLIEQQLTVNKSNRAFASACLDVICDYLIDLQTITSSDSDVKKLQETYTILQSKINQLLN